VQFIATATVENFIVSLDLIEVGQVTASINSFSCSLSDCLGSIYHLLSFLSLINELFQIGTIFGVFQHVKQLHDENRVFFLIVSDHLYGLVIFAIDDVNKKLRHPILLPQVLAATDLEVSSQLDDDVSESGPLLLEEDLHCGNEFFLL
jgi:hypothetical protein